jgi:hypothetical protein
MLLDALTRVWNSAALSVDAASDFSYDTAAAGNDISIGEPMGFGLSVGTAAKVSGGTETYEFQVIQSASATLSAPDILAKYSFTTAQATTILAAGGFIVLPIPPGAITKRYIGLFFDGANTPTITVTAWAAPLSMFDRRHDYATRIVVG